MMSAVALSTNGVVDIGIADRMHVAKTTKKDHMRKIEFTELPRISEN